MNENKVFDLSKNPFFTYKRKEVIKTPSIIEGAPEKEETKIVKDIVDLSTVSRVIAFEDLLVLQLKDGHEEAVPTPTVVKGKMEMQTRRQYTYTQLPIEDADDIARLYALLEQ